MGVEFIGDGKEETLTEIEFKNNGEEKCALNGSKVPLRGKMIATNGPTTESAQENKEAGATLVFTPKFKMQELVNAAEFEAILTSKMAGDNGNPIALTTTT